MEDRRPQPGTGRLPRDTVKFSRALAVRHGVETLALLVLADPEADEQVHQLERDRGDDAGPHLGCTLTGPQLRNELRS